ncbi:hypothetical protein L6164_030237 [Bauhinia variegata]|uniref:Uncharacterized protein n=1 Tax=Bauhinia variegata TaxID=167791 RepID=A0ACB9LC56_BAUVA|nr:hypothetical protein L6164_030237 [Bauhinia variegata]
MGACGSKPKKYDFESEAAPSEAPVTPKKAEGEVVNVTQESNNEGGENLKKEEPLVDLSEPKEKKKEESSEPAAPAVEAEKPKEVSVKAKREEPKAASSSVDKTDAPPVTV